MAVALAARSSPIGRLARLGQTRKLGKRASVLAIMEKVVLDSPDVVEDALRKGIASKPPYSFAYLKLLVEHLDGRPEQSIKHEHSGTVAHIHAQASELAEKFTTEELNDLEAKMMKLEDGRADNAKPVSGFAMAEWTPDLLPPASTPRKSDQLGGDPELENF